MSTQNLIPPTASVELVVITPDMARAMLDKNTRNRNLKPVVAAAYARDMTMGHWRFNGESVVVNCDGTIMNGQHRLTACVESGVPFASVLVTGVPTDAMQTMDSGSKRTAGDQLRLRGEVNVNSLAAVIRFALQWADGTNRFLSPTNSEISAFLDRHPEAREATQIVCQANGRGLVRVPSAPLGALAVNLLCAREASSTVESFTHNLLTGDGGVNDPTYGLFQTFLRWSQQRHIARSPWMYLAVLIKCWNGTVTDNPPKLYKHAAKESFPVLVDSDGYEIQLAA
jgi:hypothetical protein